MTTATDAKALNGNGSNSASKATSSAGAAGSVVPAESLDQLMAKVSAEGLELLGPDSVLAELTKLILNRALDEELTDELGYERGDPAGRGSGNSRNGSYPKTVLIRPGIGGGS